MNFIRTISIIIVIYTLLYGCQNNKSDETQLSTYFDYSNNEQDLLSGGARRINITTPKGNFHVWTKRVGNNPNIKVLLLHGGPGGTHELFECFDSYFPKEGFEYYYYDQLDSYYSDQPNDSSLWQVERFVEEVEQVRKALQLNRNNFYLLGRSWGGTLAMEYALKYQENLKGLIVSNTPSSIPDHNIFVNEVLAPKIDSAILGQIKEFERNKDYQNPRYNQLLMTHIYSKHVLRIPFENWPEPVKRSHKHTNRKIYIYMQGPSEFGINENAVVANWSIKSRISEIAVPALFIGATYDVVDPKQLQWMAEHVQKGRYFECPNGSHLACYDDQEAYFKSLITFIKQVDENKF